MIVQVTSDARSDLQNGYRFYRREAPEAAQRFRDGLASDIDALKITGGVHPRTADFHFVTSRRFPFTIYYRKEGDFVTVVAVVDARRSPEWIHNRLGRA